MSSGSPYEELGLKYIFIEGVMHYGYIRIG